MKFLLPDERGVMAMLEPLFGDDTKIKTAAKADSPSDWVAIYVDDSGVPVSACVCNKEFVAFGGSALMMIPAGAAKEAAANGDATDVMIESFHEIMNICSRFLMSDNTPHLKLGQVGKRSEVAALAEIEKACSRKDFQVAIPKYGLGNLACIVT